MCRPGTDDAENKETLYKRFTKLVSMYLEVEGSRVNRGVSEHDYYLKRVNTRLVITDFRN